MDNDNDRRTEKRDQRRLGAKAENRPIRTGAAAPGAPVARYRAHAGRFSSMLRGTSSMNSAALAILVIALIILLAIPLATADIIFDKQEVAIGEPVRIAILPAVQDQTLLIIAPNATYRFIGGIEENTTFIPQQPGQHLVRLLDANELIDSASFAVTDASRQASMLAPEPAHQLVTETVIATGSPIIINAPVLDVREVSIRHGNSTFTSRDSRRPITYIPEEPGAYGVSVRYVNGSVDAADVTVTGQSTPYAPPPIDLQQLLLAEQPHPAQFSVPYQEPRLRIRTADGDLVRAGLVWRRDGLVMQQTMTDIFDPQRLDAGVYDLEMALHGKSLRSMRVRGLAYDPELRLGIEELAPSQVHGGRDDALSAFAVDPSGMRFDDAEVTFIAEGHALYKCAAYDFMNRTCSGANIKVMDLVPGQQYTILLNSTDPLFSQTGYLSNPAFNTDVNGWTTSNDNANTPTFAWTGADGVPAGAADITYSTKNRVSIGSYYQSFNLTIPAGMQLANISFGAMWRIDTYTGSNPGWINLTIQNNARSANYCQHTAAFSGVTAWERITLNTTTSCPLGSFVPNTNYTFRMQCSLSTTNQGSPRSSCNWDNASIDVTYIDVTAPVLRSISATPNPVSFSDALNITLNVTDNAAEDDILVEIAGANHTMVQGPGDIYYFDGFDTARTPGLYYYRIFANDTSGNQVANGSTALNFTIRDVKPPGLNITGPKNDTYSPDLRLTAFFNATDDVGLSACWLIIDEATVNITTNPARGVMLNLSAPIAGNLHEWSVACNDTSDNPSTSEKRRYTVHSTVPTVTTIPHEPVFTNDTTVTFRYIPYDEELQNCSLWANLSGTWERIQADDAPENGSENTFGPLTLAEGAYLWNVMCTDKAGIIGAHDHNSSLTIDTTPPQYAGISVAPSSPTYAPGATYKFNITWSDTAGVQAVRLETDLAGAPANVTPAAVGAEYTYTFSDLGAGAFHYRWYANDTAGNSNQTQELQYSIAKMDSAVNLTLNGTDADRFVTLNDVLDITANATIPQGGYVELYIDGIMVKNGTSPIKALHQFSEQRAYNITAVYNATQNHTAAAKTLLVTVEDTIPPAVLLGDPLNGSVVQSSVTFSFTPVDNIGIGNCTLVLDGEAAATNLSTNNAPNHITVDGIPDGQHDWTVNCSDTSNLTGINASRKSIIVDTVAPGEFSLLLPASGNISRNLSPSFTWSQPLEPNFANYTILVDNDISFGTINHQATTYGIANTSWQFTLLDQITWYWKVIATDKAGNQNTSRQIFSYTTDATPPTVTPNTPANHSYTNTARVNLTYTPTDLGGIRNCTSYIDGKRNQTDSTITKGAQNGFVTYLDDGEHEWSVGCFDQEENFGMSQNTTIILDRTLPGPFTLTGPENNTITANPTPTYTWTQTAEQHFANYTIEVSDAEDFAHANYTLATYDIATTSIAQSPALTDGTWYWRVIAYDLAGNSIIEHPTIVIDTVPPDPFGLLLPLDGNQSRNTTPVLQWTQSADKHFTNYTILVSDTADFSHVNLTDHTLGAANTSRQVTLPQNVTWHWRVIAYDSAGLSTNSTTSSTYTPDFQAPDVSLMTPANSSTLTTAALVPFRFNASDIGTVESCSLYIDNLLGGTLYSPQKDMPLTIQATVANGNHTWTVSCTDTAGNTGNSKLFNLTMNVRITTQLLYESTPGATGFSSAAAINLSYANDGAENQVSVNVASGTMVNLVSATMTLNGSGMLIHDNAQVSFNGVFSNGRSSSFYITWKLLTKNASGTATICQSGDDAAGGTLLTTATKSAFSASCTNTLGDVRLNAGDNITLVIDTYYNAGGSRTITHFWEGASSSHVSFPAYKLGILNVSFVNYTDPRPSEGDAYVEQCNATCADGTCLDTQVYLQVYNGTAWTNVSGSGNLTLNASQLNPLSTGNVNTSAIAGFSVRGESYSFNNTLRCAAISTYSTSVGGMKNASVIDRAPPNVTLLSPSQGAAYPAQSITFGYKATDLRLANCSLWGNWSGSWKRNQTSSGMASGAPDTFAPVYLDYGIYKWNVECADNATNTAAAPANFTLNIAGDLEILSADIAFSPTTPVEGQNITLFANITNKANKTESGVTIRFWDGDPANGGVLIGDAAASFGRFGHNTTNVSWTAAMGVHRIHAMVDALDAVVESDETNNIASAQLFIPMWQAYYGNIAGAFVLGPDDNRTFLNWTLANSTGNIYISDTDTKNGIKFAALQAIGRNTTGGAGAGTVDDFEEIDALLGTTGFTDSVNDSYTAGGIPAAVQPYLLYGKTIMNVPVIDSSTDGNFTTGILWDTDDSSNPDYDGTDQEDIVFVTQITHDTVSASGVVDYEIRVPARLKSYKGSPSTVSLYYEIQ